MSISNLFNENDFELKAKSMDCKHLGTAGIDCLGDVVGENLKFENFIQNKKYIGDGNEFAIYDNDGHIEKNDGNIDLITKSIEINDFKGNGVTFIKSDNNGKILRIDGSEDVIINNITLNQFVGEGDTALIMDNNGQLQRSIRGINFSLLKVDTSLSTPQVIIPFASKPQGTWTRLYGINGDYELNSTMVNGTFTANKAGLWAFNINLTGLKGTGTDKNVFFDLRKNVSDSDVPLATYPNCLTVHSFTGINDIFNIIATQTFQLEIGDTIKPFMAMKSQLGFTVVNLLLYGISFNVVLLN